MKNLLISAEGIPNGSFVWTDENLVVNTTGEFSTTVSYVPDNPERYTAKENIPVTITVVHAHTIVIDNGSSCNLYGTGTYRRKTLLSM